MKKLYRIETNAGTAFATYDDEERIVMYLDNEETNSGIDIRNVEDDSSWDRYEEVEDFEKWLGINANQIDNPEIADEIEFD